MTHSESLWLDCPNVVVLTTGGTIEKTYDELAGSLENRESRIKDIIISRLRLPHTAIRVVSCLNKDSLQITDQERMLVVKNIKELVDADLPVVVLHGTDTLTQTADKCVQELVGLPAPVVFTGAIKPMGFHDSDAVQNVTEALLAAKLLPPGVYISFHNRVFKAPEVRKNPERGTFEKIV